LPGDAATATQSFSFHRRNRLLLPAEFRHVFDRADRSGDRYFTVLWRASNQQDPRIGFAIAKKRIARAVDRNRLRRLARESFRQHGHQLARLDMVILAQSAASQASNAELFRSLERHWRKIAAASNLPSAKITGNETTRGIDIDG
jgi:ribonuclease P protein component